MGCPAPAPHVALIDALGPLSPGDVERLATLLLMVVAALRDERPPRAIDWARLTAREREIADLVGRALTNRQIATRVGRSPHTVNYHLRRIFQKLGIRSRVELAALLLRRSPS